MSDGQRRTNMVLGARGPRSVKARLAAGVALAATLCGPLRMAVALPVSTGPSGKTSGPSVVVSRPGALPTDTPWALPTRLIPAAVTVLDGSASRDAVEALFDRRASTGLANGARPARFRIDLPAPSYLDALAVYGSTQAALSVVADGPKGRVEVLNHTSLSRGGAGWSRREIANGPLSTSLTVTFEPGRPDAALGELEILGAPGFGSAGRVGALAGRALHQRSGGDGRDDRDARRANDLAGDRRGV